MNTADQALFLYAKICSTFNSGYFIDKYIVNIMDQKVQVSSTFPFIPANLEYLGWESLILVYHLSVNELNSAGIFYGGVGPNYSTNEKIKIYIPESLEKLVDFFTEKFGEHHDEYLGYMNTGGRSYWCFSQDGKPASFGIKFGTYSADDSNMVIRNRYLSEWGINKSAKVSAVLTNEDCVVNESDGAWLEYNDPNSETLSWKHTFLVRKWKHDLAEIRAHDAIIPFYALLSPNLWSSAEFTKEIGLPVLSSKKEIKSWIIEQTAPFMVKMIELGIFKYGYNIEMHQQNITFVVRNQKIVHGVCQDLQDVCEDPVQRFFNNYKSGARPEEIFTARQYSGALGEFLLQPPRIKPYGTAASWYRQFIRVLGQYDRCLNVSFDGQEFVDYEFESEIKNQLLELAKNKYDINLEQIEIHDLFHCIANLFREWHKKLVINFEKENNLDFKKSSFTEMQQITAKGFTYGTSHSPWRFLLITENLHDYDVFKATYQSAELFLLKKLGSDVMHFYINAPEPPPTQLDY